MFEDDTAPKIDITTKFVGEERKTNANVYEKRSILNAVVGSIGLINIEKLYSLLKGGIFDGWKSLY